MATLLQLEEANRQIAKLKSLVAEKQHLADIAEQNAEAAEKEVKKLLKTQLVEPKTDDVQKENVVYVTQSQKLERCRGKPEKPSDLKVEDWIEDANLLVHERD